MLYAIWWKRRNDLKCEGNDVVVTSYTKNGKEHLNAISKVAKR